MLAVLYFFCIHDELMQAAEFCLKIGERAAVQLNYNEEMHVVQGRN